MCVGGDGHVTSHGYRQWCMRLEGSPLVAAWRCRLELSSATAIALVRREAGRKFPCGGPTVAPGPVSSLCCSLAHRARSPRR